eukprot:3670968-Prymnesium_polylepis.1
MCVMLVCASVSPGPRVTPLSSVIDVEEEECGVAGSTQSVSLPVHDMGTAAEEGSGQKRGVTMEGSDGQRGQRDVPPDEEAAKDEGQWVRSVAWG